MKQINWRVSDKMMDRDEFCNRSGLGDSDSIRLYQAIKLFSPGSNLKARSRITRDVLILTNMGFDFEEIQIWLLLQLRMDQEKTGTAGYADFDEDSDAE